MKGIIINILLLSTYFAQGQYYYIPYLDDQGVPGQHNTQVAIPANTLSSSWSQIQSSSPIPVWSPIQSLPFPFEFNGQPVSQYKVSTSAILTFDISAIAVPDTIAQSLPSPQIPDMSVCIWGINGAGSNDAIVTRTYGTSPSREHWIFFPSYSMGGGFTYWSIMLEEGTNNIYIVDQRQGSDISGGLTLGIQVNDTLAAEVMGSPNVQPVSSGTGVCYDDNYYHFINGTQPNYDIRMKSNDMLTFHWIGNAPIDVYGNLLNYGSDTIFSFNLNYLIDGGTQQTSMVSNVSIPPYSSVSFTHQTPWSPSASGLYELALFADNINGYPDQNTSNDTIYKTIEIIDTFVQRSVLHEVFTSSTCGPCKGGNEILDSILYENPDHWTCIKYQMDFPGVGDPYFSLDGSVRKSIYGVGGIPHLRSDGGFGANPSGYSNPEMEIKKNVPAYVNIDANHSLVNQQIMVNVNIDPMYDINSDDLALFIAVVESRTVNNVGNNDETEFHYVLKKMLPDAYGYGIVALVAGQNVQISEAFLFKGLYRLPQDGYDTLDISIEHSVENFDSLRVVCFIQDTITLEVHQSAWSVKNPTYIEGGGAGLFSVKVFPTLAQRQIFVEYGRGHDQLPKWRIIDVFARTLLKGNPSSNKQNHHSIDISSLSPGVYFVNLSQNGQSTTKSFVKTDK